MSNASQVQGGLPGTRYPQPYLVVARGHREVETVARADLSSLDELTVTNGSDRKRSAAAWHPAGEYGSAADCAGGPGPHTTREPEKKCRNTCERGHAACLRAGGLDGVHDTSSLGFPDWTVNTCRRLHPLRPASNDAPTAGSPARGGRPSHWCRRGQRRCVTAGS